MDIALDGNRSIARKGGLASTWSVGTPYGSGEWCWLERTAQQPGTRNDNYGIRPPGQLGFESQPDFARLHELRRPVTSPTRLASRPASEVVVSQPEGGLSMAISEKA